MTSPDVTFDGTDTWRLRWGDFGKVRVTATAQGETPLFLGVGRATDVNRWLSGAARDELTQAWGQGGAPAYRRVDGDLRSLSAPGDQTFWVNEVSGTGTIQLEWDALASNGDYVLVLANADGSQSIAAVTQLGINVPALVPVGSGLLVTAGLFIIIIGFVLIYGGASGLGRHHGGPPTPTAGPMHPAGSTGTTTAGPPISAPATTVPGAGP